MECNFVIGQKVVCINDSLNAFDDFSPFDRVRGLDGLKVGQIYTIRDLVLDKLINEVVVLVEEIHRKPSWDGSLGYMTEAGFRHQRFAPLQKKETGIEVFNSILNNVNNGNHDNNYGFSLDELFETVKW